MSSENKLIVNIEMASGTFYSERKGSWNDSCCNFAYEFTNKVYGIIGPFGSGGFALSNTLAGNVPNYRGNVIFNGNTIEPSKLKHLSCYVFNLPINYKKNKTIRDYLDEGFKNNPHLNETTETFLDKFYSYGLIPRLDFKLNNLSSEFYNATFAIGYAQGKKIFCFPFMEYNELLYFIGRFYKLTEFLKNNGCIVIIPTDKKDYLDLFIDEFISIKGSQEIFIEIVQNVNKLLNSGEKTIEELAIMYDTHTENIKVWLEKGKTFGYIKE